MPNHKNVIPFPQTSTPATPVWTFLDFEENGENRIQQWYDNELSEEGQDKFDALIKNISKIPNHLEWCRFKKLKGEAGSEGVWQIEFRADKREYRVHGVFGFGSKRAVLIQGCYHKGDNYTPTDAIQIACRRAQALREGRAQTSVREIEQNI